MTENKEYFIKISKDLLDMVDETKEYQLQLVATLIYLTKNHYELYGDSYVYTTPSLLIKQFGNYSNINEKSMERQRPKIIDALLDLRDIGLISFSCEVDKNGKEKKPTFKEELYINTKTLLELANKEPFVKLDVEMFLDIMQDKKLITVNNEQLQKNAVESYLLWMYCSVASEWNVKNMAKLKEYDGEVSCHIDSKENNELSELKFVFCNASIDVLRSRKHQQLELDSNWCGDDYAFAYINKLIELGCIRVIKRRVKTNEGWRDMNFYYSPMFGYDDMLVMVRQWASRKRYAIKERDKAEQPTQPIEPKKTSRVNRGKDKPWFKD